MRVILASSLLVALTTLAGCADNESFQLSSLLAAPRANMQLKKADAALTNTSDTQWTLTKTGSTGGATITWLAQATQGSTTNGMLIYNGVFRVENKGNAGATIGNIVVNLQTFNAATNKWITRYSVVADATQDDAATSANVNPKPTSENKSTFTENSASGSLLFTDATTNSAFALVPQVTVAPGEVKKLLFTATYDNAVLNLAVGTATRAEILVSFGNAKAGGTSAANIDINGNGIVDSDEAWIQTIDAHPAATVPAGTPANTNVVLTDTVSDITTTGTVTFSNPVININGLSGTVIVNYDGGASGGTITNCAHLTSAGQQTNVVGDNFNNVNPVDLTACDTQVIGPHMCSPGAPGCGWANGDMVTYNQDNWGTIGTTASNLLADNFFAVFTSGVVEIGIAGVGGFSAIFSSANAVINYQPTTGVPGPLNADLFDPTSTSSGVFGGHVLALQIDVAFTDADVVSGSAPLFFGNLRVCNLTDTPAYNGLSVRQVLDALNTALGGGTAPYTYDQLSTLAADLSNSFESGTVSVFAQQHLFDATSCP
jgi:hypothetical protein